MTSGASLGDVQLLHSLLDDPLIDYRPLEDGSIVRATLPQLFVAMAVDAVRDFPQLRPHQRHPWHALLVQLAVIALHRAGRREVFTSVEDWRAALLALTPDDPDGAAWCLVAPPYRPAFLQAPVPDGSLLGWKSIFRAADELDMLVTSKNHDVKASRARGADVQEWLFALMSLQTQEGFLGAGNYGISRMNGGFASRPGVGVAPSGYWGQRWKRDVQIVLGYRERIAEQRGLASSGGLALLWLIPWDGSNSVAFASLDPFYIELCRRVRLLVDGGQLLALGTGSRVARIAAKELNGVTGDAWTPIDTAAGKALTIASEGFHYKLVSELLFGRRFVGGVAQSLEATPAEGRLQLVAQGVARGKGKTEGYHERRVPISRKLRRLLIEDRDRVAQAAFRRVTQIGDMRKLLWLSLATLFNNGMGSWDVSETIKEKATRFSQPFERAEDARFFDDLTSEIEADDSNAERLRWQAGLVDRAEAVLRAAFDAGPRSAQRRYRARAAALSRFRSALHGENSPLPELTHHWRQRNEPSHRDLRHEEDEVEAAAFV